jgi:putative transposase
MQRIAEQHFRVAIKKHKVLPTDDSVQKLFIRCSRMLHRNGRNRRLAMGRFIIEFGDRLSDHL